MSNTGKINIYDLSRSSLAKELVGSGFKEFNANQIFSWLYQKNENDVENWTNISKSFEHT